MKSNTTCHAHLERIADLRALAAYAIRGNDLIWRRHGIGLLQAYIREGDDHEVRLHIWDPSIQRPGIVDHGDIHNHRFDLDSTLLYGSLQHEEFCVSRQHVWNTCAGWNSYEVVHAREDMGARYKTKQHRISVVESKIYEFKTGDRYSFTRGAFHRTIVQDLCITLITKYNQRSEKALVLARHGTPPVHAMELDDDFDMGPVLSAALKALE